MKKSNKIFFLSIVFLAGTALGLFAGGSKEEKPPTASAGGGDSVLSPNFSPGVKDSAVIPIKAETDETNKRVVKQYKLVLADSAGKTVKEWSNRDENEPGFFARIFIALGFMDKSKVEVPASVVWDGRDASSAFVPDGVYSYVLEIWDDSGISAKSPASRITVDNTPPRAAIKPALAVFSPDGDGRKDLLSVTIEASKETLWKGALLDSSGKEIAVPDFSGGLPAAFDWDGTDGRGKRLPDGAYSLSLSSVDEAGNAFSVVSEPVTVDTAPRNFSLGLDVAAFSPNGDGIKDGVTLTVKDFVPAGFLAAAVEVLDASGAAVRRFDFEKTLPDSLVFDGRDGKVLPEGVYKARMKADYLNGAAPEAVSTQVALDLTPPRAEVTADTLIISPDGDGSKDSVEIGQRADPAPRWKGTLSSAKDPGILVLEWEGSPAEKLSWNGSDGSGKGLPDGVYSYVLAAEDEAGNRGTSAPLSITIDRRKPGLAAGADLDAFSPNGDGFKDSVTVSPIAEAADEVEAYVFTVLDDRGKIVKTIKEKKSLPAAFAWDGRADGGNPAPDGAYKAEIEASYPNGAHPRAETKPFLLDATPPRVELLPGALPFSPDNDGRNDVFELGIESNDASPLASWTAKILDPSGKDFAEVSGEGAPPERASWDGLSSKGDYVKAGETYTLAYTIADALGNKAEGTLKIPVDVLVFKDGLDTKIRAADVNFAPFATEYLLWNPEVGKANTASIDWVAEMLKKFPAYRVRLQGHAVSVFWKNKEASRREHLQTLLPLSRARAETVKQALVERGIEARRIEVEGYGGDFPIVPFSDYQKRWVDRRVEFILLRE